VSERSKPVFSPQKMYETHTKLAAQIRNNYEELSEEAMRGEKNKFSVTQQDLAPADMTSQNFHRMLRIAESLVVKRINYAYNLLQAEADSNNFREHYEKEAIADMEAAGKTFEENNPYVPEDER
jgi:hypothetical protein